MVILHLQLFEIPYQSSACNSDLISFIMIAKYWLIGVRKERISVIYALP